MVKYLLAKEMTRVRFPLSAYPIENEEIISYINIRINIFTELFSSFRGREGAGGKEEESKILPFTNGMKF